jgi:hypothetical protein
LGKRRGGHLAVVGLDDLLDDVEPESQALLLA